MLLVATAIAVLLAGCGSSQREDQGSSQGSEQEDGSTQQTSEAMTNEQTSEPTTNETVVDRCADSGSTGRQQEQASGGEVSNGKIAFIRSIQLARDIYVVDGQGAHESRLTHTPQVSEDHPVWSPDGQKIAFITPDTTPGEEKSALCVMNADGTNKTQLAEDVWTKPSWSPDGQKIAFITGDDSDLSVINVDGTHKVSLITASFARIRNAEKRTLFGRPVWSPTGNKIAFASRTLEEGYATASASASVPAPLEEGVTGIYLINVDGTGLRKLTNTEYLADALVWSPDGEQIAFSHKGTTHAINPDGSGRKLLTEGYAAVWSPDGQKIAFVNESSTYVQSLHVINADGSGLRRLAKTTEMGLTLPAWSPDGEKIAFHCIDDPREGTSDLCVINADGTEWKRIAVKGDHNASMSWGRE